jgi:hypothetical protein
MQHGKVKLIIVLLLSLGLKGLQAQETIPATGGNATGSGGSVSYTLGQVVYTANTSNSGTISQGIQQPYEILVISAIEETKGISLNCKAYPNPTTDCLVLKIEGEVQVQSIVYLYDINGKLILSECVAGNEITISMNNLVSATYFLKVTQNNKEMETFKIIKK